MLSGPEGSGKSLIALLAAIKTKSDGGNVAIIDAEHRFNANYAYRSGLGIPGQDYILTYPMHLEGGLELIRKFAGMGIDYCVIDTITSLAPMVEVEADLIDQQMALQARINSKFFRSATDEIANSGMCVIIITQLRNSLSSYGNPIVRPGGKAKDFYSAIAIDMQAPGWEWVIGATPKPKKDGEESPKDNKKKPAPLGMTVNGKLWKNIFGPNFTEFATKIRFTPHLMVNRAGEALALGRTAGVLVKKDGSKISSSTAIMFYNGEEIGKGNDPQTETNLYSDLDMLSSIENDVRQAVRENPYILYQNGSESGEGSQA